MEKVISNEANRMKASLFIGGATVLKNISGMDSKI